jgi:hypothetical protein
MEKLVKLDWSVRTEKLVTESGLPINKKIAVIREDTNTILGVNGDGYVPYQNSELFELLSTVSEKTGLVIHKEDYFQNGAKVYIQMKSNDLTLRNTNGVDDKIEGFITGINTFDGTGMLGFGTSSVTISCLNKFFGAYRDIETKVRHTKNMHVKIDAICRRVEMVLDEEKTMFNDIVKMSETRLNPQIRDLVVRRLLDVDKTIDYTIKEAISTRKLNQINSLESDITNEMIEKGDNLWGLMSGITKYTTHHISANDNSQEKLFGKYGEKERLIFNELVSLV